ncbi:MAG: PEP-CTERM sorting domain-containing protein [Gemmatimonadaceae bacterium]|nr:PEP-CTERM sorting domain-containing protein [Gemmatimonadaceae bacterium]
MRTIRRLAVLALLSPLSLQAQAGQVVGPGGSSTVGNPTGWQPDAQFGATAEVTRTNPCGTAALGVWTNNACSGGYAGVGAGSLEMHLAGNNQAGGTPEWAFWYRWAGGPTAADRYNGSFGSLDQLSALSFDWFRQSDANSMNATLASDWQYKTPVMRLRLLESDGNGGSFESELVWEGFFNQASLGGTTPLDQWVRQGNMQADRFWYLRPPGSNSNGQTTVDQGGCTLVNVNRWDANATGSTIDQLIGRNSPVNAPGCVDPTAQILGIAVGIGNNWPHAYTGFADNVRMGFTDANGGYTQALDANFDFVGSSTVPEPSTYALMGTGLLALAWASRRRRNANTQKDQA